MKKKQPSWGRKNAILLLLFCIFIGNKTTMFAQDYSNFCATEDNTDPDPPGVFSYSTDPAYLEALDPAVINIHFWRIDNKDGTPHPLEATEYDALKAVQSLNILFNPSGIIFKYGGFGSFRSPPDVIWEQYNHTLRCCDNFPFDPAKPCANDVETLDPDGFQVLSRCQRGLMFAHAQQNNAYRVDAMNVYIAASTIDFGGSAPTVSNRIILSKAGLEGGTFPHEMGHALNLNHTFGGWAGNSCEQVTRDPNDTNDPNDPNDTYFNADYAGDAVVDTAAMPEFTREYCLMPNAPPNGDCSPGGADRFKYYDQENCEYIGTIFPNTRGDCKGTPYEIFPVDARNYMGYNAAGCSDTFTVGQGIRMKEALEFYSVLQPIKTDIKFLYEPYTGSYPTYYPHPLPWEDPLFQPGFDYSFVACDCSCTEELPLSYEDISFTYTNNILHIGKEETDFSIITHPNHTAIHIDFPFELPDDYGQSTRRCYDNYYTPPVIGGSITKFNDGVFNANVTITPQDSTAINNPTLIDDLNPGLYNIQKTIIDGSSEEQVILKENN